MQFLPYIVHRSALYPYKKGSVEDLTFNEAVFISSPDLFNEFQRFSSGHIIDSKAAQKIHISAYKYHVRSYSRCTPFGLFAGVGVGKWSDNNEIIFNENPFESLNRKTRLDMNVVCNLVQNFLKQEYIFPFLKYFPNNSLYKLGNSYRYVEYSYFKSQRIHHLSKVDLNEYLELILKSCEQGKTVKEIEELLAFQNISSEEALPFIKDLIDSQLLISELEPTVTGLDYFESVVKKLKILLSQSRSNDLKEIIEILEKVSSDIKIIDTRVFNEIQNYEIIHTNLQNILPELRLTNLFQTDLFKKALIANINSKIQNQITNTIQFLNKITPIRQNNNLENFKNKYLERYEMNEMPLLTVLDSESGIGYPIVFSDSVETLIDDIAIYNESIENNIKITPFHIILHRLLLQSIKENKKVLQIKESDFETLDYSTNKIPHSQAVMFKVLDSVTNKIEITGIGGSSAINLLGRFSNENTDIHNIIQEIAKHEQIQFGDKILAEIVHLPENRTGNILYRSAFRDYEIPYLAKSAVKEENRIHLKDLYISVFNNRIILKSKKLNKEIIPKLSNSHNFNYNSLPVYHFLCDLQNQYFEKTFFGIDFGELSNQYKFIPRIEYNNVVLSPARWQFTKTETKIFSKSNNDIEKLKIFFAFKNEFEIPDIFYLSEGDNDLLIDTNKEIAILTFIEEIKGKNNIILKEFLFENNNALIKDSKGNGFTNECICIVLNEYKIPPQPVKSLTEITTKQNFSIGSEWLYFKIYCGVKTADQILIEIIKPIVEDLISEKTVIKWFFIRYADPEFHLRIRLNINNIKSLGSIIQLFNNTLEPLIEQNLVSKIQTDTYKREIDRYGANSIELAESLFYSDSSFVCNFLSLLDSESGTKIRWQIALRSTDEFLNEFNYSVEEKYNVFTSLSTAFFKEHGGKKELKLQLDNKFRDLRKDIEEAIDKTEDQSKEFFPVVKLLESRKSLNEDAISQLLNLKTANSLKVDLTSLICSLIHMNLNRIFTNKGRKHELVVYDFLSRYYKSSIAKEKTKSKLTAT